MQEEQYESPFMKRTQEEQGAKGPGQGVPEESQVNIPTPYSLPSTYPTPYHLPPQVPFISSLAVSAPPAMAALNSFMKYDRKWRGGAGLPSRAGALQASDSESEPQMSEAVSSEHSPVKIASELEERAFPAQRRRRQSSGSLKGPNSPSPRRLQPEVRNLAICTLGSFLFHTFWNQNISIEDYKSGTTRLCILQYTHDHF